MGVIHFLLAFVLKLVLVAPMYIVNSVVALFKREYNIYHHNIALMVDIYGNHLCKYAFNGAFLKKNRIITYGTGLKTISHVTAMNYKNNSLTPLGLLFAKILIIFKDKAF